MRSWNQPQNAQGQGECRCCSDVQALRLSTTGDVAPTSLSAKSNTSLWLPRFPPLRTVCRSLTALRCLHAALMDKQPNGQGTGTFWTPTDRNNATVTVRLGLLLSRRLSVATGCAVTKYVGAYNEHHAHVTCICRSGGSLKWLLILHCKRGLQLCAAT